jgi:hypothetical protein
MTVIDDLGFLIRESQEEYQTQAKDYLTSHGLNDFRRDPFLFHKKLSGLIDEEDRPAFSVGRAAHTLVLEGREAYQRQYAFGGPTNAKTGEPYGRYTKTFEEWATAQGKPVIDNEQARLIENLNDSVRNHPLAVELLSDGVAEGVVRTQYMGTPCQARLDWLNPQRGIIDLKTTDSLSFLEGSARVYGYIHQMAFYRSLVFQATGKVVPAFIVAVEKREPYRSGAWTVGQDVLGAAQKENEQAMERLAECRQLNQWPTGYETLRTIDWL